MRKIIDSISPGLVILDVHLMISEVYYYHFGYKTITVNTTIFSGKDDFVPPYNSSIIPQKKILFKLCVKYLWLKNYIFKRLYIFFKRIISFGNYDISFFMSFANKIGFPFDENYDYNRCFINGFKHLHELVLVPKSFDFPHTDRFNVHKLSLPISRQRETNINDRRYLVIIDNIRNRKANNENIKLIYCSLGTLTNLDLNVTAKFFKKIISVCHTYKNYIFILSVGRYYDIQSLLPMPQNMYVFPHVPQIDLLLNSDLMITHGGMNSILECIELGVPMLVYPLSKKWDQPGNSARVVYHGLGLRGSIRCDSEKKIAKKIAKIIDNYDFFKYRILKMKLDFEENSKPKEIIRLIEYLID